MFTSLLPPNSDHMMIFGRLQLCNLSHSTECMRICTNRAIVTSQMNHHMFWIGWQQECKHVSGLRLLIFVWAVDQMTFAGNFFPSGSTKISDYKSRQTTGSPSSLGTVNMTLRNSVNIRVCMGIKNSWEQGGKNSNIDLLFFLCVTCVFMAFGGVRSDFSEF